MGRRVAQFELIDQISTGSVGVVWRAMQVNLNRHVAVKELHSFLVNDAAFVEGFEREAKAAAALEHENIVRVIDFGCDDETYYLAMELVDGTNLQDLLEDAESLPVSAVLTIAVDILSALEHAHHRGIIHRDVKPANIVLSRNGTVKLADFSIAFSSKTPTDLDVLPMGSPYYMSPEEHRAEPIIDGRADTYSLAVVLHQALSGAVPFDARTMKELIAAISSPQSRSLHDVVPEVPPTVSEVIAKGMAPKANDRWTNAASFRAALKSAIDAEGLTVRRDLVVKIVEDPSSVGQLRTQEANEAAQLRRERQDHLERKAEDEAFWQRKLDAAKYGDKSGDRRLYWLLGVLSVVALVIGGVAAYSQLQKNRTSANTTTTATVTATVTVEPPRRSPTPRRTAVAKTSPPRVPRKLVWLTVTSDEPAKVYIDGKAVGSVQKRARFEVTPGPHEIRLVHAGESAVTKRVVLSEDSTTHAVSFQPPPTPVATGSGQLLIQIPPSPWAIIRVDGRNVAETPLAKPLSLPSGTHKVEFTNPKCSTVIRRVRIAAGKTTRLSVPKWCR